MTNKCVVSQKRGKPGNCLSFHRCPDDGSRATTVCTGGNNNGTTPTAGSSACPPARIPTAATLRISGNGAVSERYPLGKDRQSSVAATTTTAQQPQHKLQPTGYHHQDRYLYNERPSCSTAAAPLGNTNFRYSTSGASSGADRYHTQGSLERYHGGTATTYTSRTPTPSSERYHAVDKKYHLETVEATTQATACDRYTPTERHRRNSKSDVYKIRERSTSSDRKERLQREHLQGRGQQYETTNGQYERPATPSILACPPAPAPFGGPSSAVSEPPSPAPACDRFVAPPPAEGEPETSDCYAHGTFPSPVAPAAQERFAPPPIPAPSPTEDRPNNTNNSKQRYHHYTSPNQSTDRYYQYKLPSGASPTPSNGSYYQTVNNGDLRFGEGQRYVPPNAHMPVERYVPQPQPQEPFYTSYHSPYERYPKLSFVGSDPYMRRDLTYHYRLPIQFGQNQFQKIRYSHLGTPSRAKCCQFESASTGTRSSPGSSSSTSSVASGGHASSLQDVQNYQAHYKQEKSTQCSRTPTLVQCRHGGCDGAIEYVGASGGRRICATPPPRPQERCEGCIQAAAQAAALAVASQLTAQQKNGRGQQQQAQTWRSSTQSNQNPTLPPTDQSLAAQLTPRHIQNNRSLTPTNNIRSLTPTLALSSSATEQSGLSSSLTSEERREDTPPRIRHSAASSSQNVYNNAATPQIQAAPSASSVRGVAQVQRAVSMPSTPAVEQRTNQNTREEKVTKRVNYSQSERVPNRPALNRSVSRREMIKNYIKKETANFFGVDEENEDEEQKRWLDRRKRMASRTMGPLKEEYTTLSYRPQSQKASPLHLRHRRAASESVPPSTSGYSGQLIAGGRPDVLPGDVADGSDERMSVGLRRKDSVARMTWNGLNYVVTTLTGHRQRNRSQQSTWSRSFAPDVPQTSRLSSPEEEVFFDRSRTTLSDGDDTVDRSERALASEPAYRTERDSSNANRYSAAAPSIGWRARDLDGVELRHPERRAVIGASRIAASTLDNVLDNSDRRQYGMGWIEKLFRRSYRKSVVADARIQSQLDDMDDHRPYFTYWVTTVQVLVLLISIVCYGFGPFGVDLQAKSGQVLVTSLSLQQVDYMEPANFWGGPRAADLIHLGAKFAPCMRLDDKITQQIEKTRKKEKETACCIRNDDSGCVQSSQADCSIRGLRPTKTISTWKKWTSGDSGPGGRISGSVCGLDPKYCDAPASVHPYEWPDDITKWPICRKTNNQISNAAANRRDKSAPRDKLAEHMVCEVIGHPCCIGIHGQCRITTREYCDFVRGTFHEEASLCSQVSCLNDVCGMVSFYFPDVPDQFYRLWTSLFLHAGVLQLIITIMVQHFLMRDLEKLTGSLRIGIIYVGSGVGGNLASAIFVPYRADVGPAGSQFGLLACLIVEVLNSWPMLKHPNQALCKLLSITMVLFLIGLLPWVDNYAHLFGFVFGFLLSYALLPFVSFGQYDRQKKVFLIWVCLVTALILFIVLVLLFYIIPVYDCKICSYFNCLPLTRDFCATQNINFKREEPVV